MSRSVEGGPTTLADRFCPGERIAADRPRVVERLLYE